MQTLGRAYHDLHINWHGLFLSPMSWAQVNREMALALDRLGCRVSVVARRGFCYRADFPVPERLRFLRSVPTGSQWDIAFEHPLTYGRLRARHRAGLLVYEASRLPGHWVESITRHLDLLVVPSRFCRQAALDSGVPAEKIAVVPYGFDPERFRPGLPTRSAGSSQQSPFIFLCVAMPHGRKGVRELVQAFTEEFRPDEPVRLVIKMPYAPAKGRTCRAWEVAPAPLYRSSPVSGRQQDPRVCLVDRAEPPESMPVWYALCDASVQPSYGEGFGLSILEAKAMGKPTLVTGWGGHLDFCTPENSFLVDYDLVPAGEEQYDSGAPGALFAKPSIASLREQMRRVYSDPAEAKKRVNRSLEDVRDYTWTPAAAKLVDLLLARS